MGVAVPGSEGGHVTCLALFPQLLRKAKGLQVGQGPADRQLRAHFPPGSVNTFWGFLKAGTVSPSWPKGRRAGWLEEREEVRSQPPSQGSEALHRGQAGAGQVEPEQPACFKCCSCLCPGGLGQVSDLLWKARVPPCTGTERPCGEGAKGRDTGCAEQGSGCAWFVPMWPRPSSF